MRLPKITLITAGLAVPSIIAASLGLSSGPAEPGTTSSTTPAVASAAHVQHDSHDRHDQKIRGKRHRGKIPVIAHRGDSRLAPEETLSAYEQAVDAGADVLEGDVQLTKDGEMVLLHDDDLTRTTNVEEVFPDRESYAIGEFTLEEVTSLDAGSWFHEDFASEKVATVEELLQATDTRKTGLTLELKSPENSPGVATKLAHLLKQHRLTDDSTTRGHGDYRIMVHSRDQEALREFNAIVPDVPLVYLTGGEMLDDAELAELATWTMGVFANPKVTNAADIERAHDAGLEVYSDPMDDPDHMEMALNQGYDHLVTNLPELANRAVHGKKTLFRDNEGVVVDNVIPDPAGDDVQPETGEYVALRNTTDEPIDVSGHYFRENGGRIIGIGEGYEIQPGSLLRVYVGPGTNTEEAYYNGYASGFLNNGGGDVLTYFSDEHEVLDSWGYIIP